MKKLFALCLSLILALGLATSALAANVETGDAKITITRDPSYTAGDGSTTESGNETYTYYRILFATYANGEAGTVESATGELSEQGHVAYYVTSETEANALKGLKVKNASNEDVNLFNVIQSTDGTRYNVSLAYADATAEQIAAALETVKSNFPTATVTRSGADDVEIKSVAKGYYLIESSLGSKLAVQTLGDVTIKEKNTYPTVDKKQDDETTPTYADDDVHVKVGDTVYYQVTVTVPATANGDITVSDTMSSGLTYQTDTGLTWAVSAGTITSGTDYEVTNPTPSEKTWEAKIHATDATKGKTITITYQAIVNKDALTDTGKKNEVELDYSHYVQKDEVKYDTSATGLIKFDGDKAEVKEDVVSPKEGQSGTYLLADAEFKLQVKNGDDWEDLAVVQEPGYYRPMNGTETAATIKSDANGEVIIRGLDKDKTYRLVETKAPAEGYNLATEPVSLTLTDDTKAGVIISGDASDAVTKLAAASVGKLANNKGVELPSTGGIGTTIFYIVGGILVLGAGVLLITKKRMTKEG